MFISADFWQPDRDQWKSVLTLVALAFALINVGLMRVIWKRHFRFSERTYRLLGRVHRGLGWSAIGIMLFIAVITCIGIIGYGGYGTRPTWHSWLGVSVLALIGVKVVAVRRGLPDSPQFQRYAVVTAAGLTVALAVAAATVLRGPGAYALPLFPLVALAGLSLWRRFGYLPVIGTVFAVSIALLFATSAGWWFVKTANAGGAPDVSGVTAMGRGDAALGATVFRRAGCSGCHGVDGSGGLGPSLRTLSFQYRFSDEQIAQQVRRGMGVMPAFGADVVSDTEISGLISYIRGLYEAQ